MKATLYSTASAAALLAFAVPAFADADFTGVAQLSIGRGSADATLLGSSVGSPTLYDGEARGLWPLSPDVHVQADVFWQQSDNLIRNWGASKGDTTEFGGAVHLLHPFENRARFGVAGSIWGNDILVSAGSGDASATYGLGAVEGQFFGSDWTVMAQAGLFEQLSCGNSNCRGALDSGTYLRGGVRYFLHDNTVLSLEGLHMWGAIDDSVFGGKSPNVNATHWTLAAEHRFESSPFSAFVSVGHESTEASAFLLNQSVETTTGSIGVKFYFNRPSLRENDRSGAQLDTPRFGDSLELTGPVTLGGFGPP